MSNFRQTLRPARANLFLDKEHPMTQQWQRIASRLTDVGGIPVARAIPVKERRTIGPKLVLASVGLPNWYCCVTATKACTKASYTEACT